MPRERSAVTDSQCWEAELDNELTLSDFFDFMVMSLPRCLRSEQRDTQLNTVIVSVVHDILKLPKL